MSAEFGTGLNKDKNHEERTTFTSLTYGKFLLITFTTGNCHPQYLN